MAEASDWFTKEQLVAMYHDEVGRLQSEIVELSDLIAPLEAACREALASADCLPASVVQRLRSAVQAVDAVVGRDEGCLVDD